MSFSDLVSKATPADLRRRSNGTRLTNRQLLFHMLFGTLIVRTLMPLVHGFGHLPERWSRRFAATLNAGRRPFHLIDYLGSCGGGQVLQGQLWLLSWIAPSALCSASWRVKPSRVWP